VEVGSRCGRDVNREAGEARRGHGCAVPLQQQDAAFGLGARKRRPYNSRMRPSAWAREATPLQLQDAAFGLGVAKATPLQLRLRTALQLRLCCACC